MDRISETGFCSEKKAEYLNMAEKEKSEKSEKSEQSDLHRTREKQESESHERAIKGERRRNGS